jgi:hypothetical protein
VVISATIAVHIITILRSRFLLDYDNCYKPHN